MSVDHNAARDAKGVSKYDVCRFASHAAERQYLLHRSRYLAAVNLNKPLACGLDVLCLVSKETR